MNSLRSYFQALSVTSMLVAAPLSAAHAQTVDAALDRLKALVEDQSAKIEWTSADISGSDAVLVDVKVGGDGQMVPIGNVTLMGIEESDVGYRVESITLDRYAQDNASGTSVTVDGVSMTGVILPSEDEVDNFGGFLFYETADVNEVRVNTGGSDVFSLTDMRIEVTDAAAGEPMGFTGTAEGFTADLSSIQDPQQKAVIQALGYEKISGTFELAGSWNPQDGRMALSQYDLTVADAGTLGFSFDLGGYTPDFIKSLRELQQQMAARPEGDNSAQGLAMLGLMQQLTFNTAEIAFTDDSLTNKVLDFVAKSQGMRPSDIANQAKAVLPFAMAQLNNPELTAMVTQAVSAFLDDPKSLRITAEPGNPVPFALIAAGAMSAPQELPKTLGVTVTANE
ncbi:hypothetical protein [Mesorhizobium sp. CAU 1732]|uniref:hypothetical protein n=1 Tax=Mesorhizobium sp. CAU 1732 TaxID=3140358 RepID=UPI003261785F